MVASVCQLVQSNGSNTFPSGRKRSSQTNPILSDWGIILKKALGGGFP
jgi:hypothetical protein